MEAREHILYLQGIACPRTKANMREENTYTAKDIRALEHSGCMVTRVGSAEKGFSLDDIKCAFEKNPHIRTIIINAHGGIHEGDHYIDGMSKVKELDPAHAISGKKLYESLAKFSGKKPLNIFMFSCGSTNGHISAVESLPVGSTLVTFGKYDEKLAHNVLSSGFQVKTNLSGNFAELLFLTMLSKGFDGQSPYWPHLTVRRESESKSYLWDLCDMVQYEVLAAYPNRRYLITVRGASKAGTSLKEFFSQKKITKALKAMDYYVAWCKQERSVRKAIPFSLKFKIDEDDFYRKLTKHRLTGVMSAITYALRCEQIGAFKATEVPHQPVAQPKVKPAHGAKL